MLDMQGWNPRLHLAAAIGWAVVAVVTLAAWITASQVAGQAEQRLAADAEALLAEYATQVRDAVAMNLKTRRTLLQTIAAQSAPAAGPSAGSAPDDAAQRAVAASQAQFPEFTWLAVADAGGHVLAQAGAAPLAGPLAAQDWFQRGRVQPVVGDIHAPAAVAAAAPGAHPMMLAFAVPWSGGGALVALLPGSVLDDTVAHMQQAFNRNRHLELLLVAADGGVLAGPAGWAGQRLNAERDASENGRYLAGSRARLRLADDLGLGWTAIVRQRADEAMAPVLTTRRTAFLTVFLAGLLSAAAAALVTQWLMRRLTRLAADAEAVRRGTRRSLAAPAGADEVSRIGAALAQLVDHLQAEKHALQALNAALDQRVVERTARIERMADETRHAAVTRERLRLARDLHDTLAHSLMALLTQIRLVRKLRARMDAAELDAELGRAEAVAATGLVEARAAIAQMRDNGVGEAGLGPALHDLLRRFGQRTGIAVTVSGDSQAGPAGDQRAQTVFRIVEEALRNVERHAAAQAVRLSMTLQVRDGDGEWLCIEVADDGVGFDPAAARPGHYGVHGMREQAALIAAEFAIDSRTGHGTRVSLAFAA